MRSQPSPVPAPPPRPFGSPLVAVSGHVAAPSRASVPARHARLGAMWSQSRAIVARLGVWRQVTELAARRRVWCQWPATSSRAGVVGRAAGCGSARGEDAELVALGVGEDDPAHVALADFDRLGADSAEACDLGAVVVVGEGCDVEVHTQLGGLGLGDAVQVEVETAAAVIAEPDA